MIEAIKTTGAPAAIGPYSQAVRAGEWLFISGQIPLDPASGDLVAGGIRAQTRQALANLRAILEASGGTIKDLIKVSIFLTDLSHFSAVNEAYEEFLAGMTVFPARVCVEVSGLPRGAEVEIEAIARISPSRAAAEF